MKKERIRLLERLLGRPPRDGENPLPEVAAEASRRRFTHDYTDPTRGWGHDTSLTPRQGGTIVDAWGWGDGISKEDYLIFSIEHPIKKDRSDTTRYKVDEIEYMRDPSDQWRAVLSLAPRTMEEKAKDHELLAKRTNLRVP